VKENHCTVLLVARLVGVGYLLCSAILRRRVASYLNLTVMKGKLKLKADQKLKDEDS
jgi:hypothetical protein